MVIAIGKEGPCAASEATEPIWMARGSGICAVGYPLGKLGYSTFRYRPIQPVVSIWSASEAVIQISVALKCEKLGEGYPTACMIDNLPSLYRLCKPVMLGCRPVFDVPFSARILFCAIAIFERA